MTDNKPVEGEVVGGELTVILNEQGVSQDSQKALVEAFGGPFEEVGEILADYQNIKVTDVTQIKEMAEAREKRIALKNARTTVERKRKELKEDSLKTGRAIDAVARFVKEQIEPAEKYLETQEKFKELRDKAEAAERLTARTEAIAKFTDPTLYNLEAMPEEAFQQLLIKLDQEAAAKVEAERKAEEEKLAAEKAERERQAKIAEENKRLQREAEEQRAANDRKLARVNQVTALGMVWSESLQAYKLDEFTVSKDDIIELNDVKFKVLVSDIEKKVTEARAAAEKAEQAAAAEREEALRVEREKAAAEAKAAQEAADAERAKREKLEQEAAERKAAEEKAERDAAEAQRQSLLAPDKDKINSVVPKLVAIKAELPATKEAKAQELVQQIDAMLDKAIKFVEERVEAL